jgi:hypothetical protein
VTLVSGDEASAEGWISEGFSNILPALKDWNGGHDEIWRRTPRVRISATD